MAFKSSSKQNPWITWLSEILLNVIVAATSNVGRKKSGRSKKANTMLVLGLISLVGISIAAVLSNDKAKETASKLSDEFEDYLSEWVNEGLEQLNKYIKERT